MSVHILDHPLLQHKLTILRDKNTGTRDFRATVSEIAMLMCYEATRDLRHAARRCGDSRRHGPAASALPARRWPLCPSSAPVWAWWTAC